jgi:hypothetical protein
MGIGTKLDNTSNLDLILVDGYGALMEFALLTTMGCGWGKTLACQTLLNLHNYRSQSGEKPFEMKGWTICWNSIARELSNVFRASNNHKY